VIREILKSNFQYLDLRIGQNAHIAGVPTGFADFDTLTSGLQPGDLMIVAARPAMGKTTWAFCVARHAAVTQRIPVLIFTLAANGGQLVDRILCSEADADVWRLRTLFLADEDWRNLARAMGRLSDAPIFIDDSAAPSVTEIRDKALKLKAEHGLGLIVIDYIQLIRTRHAENRTEELNEIARGIKSLAVEIEVPIIAVSQLSRGAETMGSKRPTLSHLRETGDLESVADIVVFLFREGYYDLEKSMRASRENVCEVIVAKHHNGPTGTLELYFQPESSRFANLARAQQAPRANEK
jgi:replicative DNA helicase